MAYPTSPAPNNIEETKREYLVDTVKAEDGKRYTRLRSSKLLRTWKLTYEQLGATDQTTLNNWFSGVYGEYQSDTWAQPYTAETVTVRCTDWNWKLGAYPRRTLTVTMEEQP